LLGQEPGRELLKLAALAQRHPPQDRHLVGFGGLVAEPD
jgi:hypothetical protein